MERCAALDQRSVSAHHPAMRVWVLILAVFSVLGIGSGLLLLVASIGRSYEMAVGASLPLLFGVVSTSGLVITLAVDEARKDIIARLGDK